MSLHILITTSYSTILLPNFSMLLKILYPFLDFQRKPYLGLLKSPTSFFFFFGSEFLLRFLTVFALNMSMLPYLAHKDS